MVDLSVPKSKEVVCSEFSRGVVNYCIVSSKFKIENSEKYIPLTLPKTNDANFVLAMQTQLGHNYVPVLPTMFVCAFCSSRSRTDRIKLPEFFFTQN